MVSTSQVLLLAVADQHAARFGDRSQHVFAGKDGSIGRADDCDWVLSASGVSRVHAVIRCLNGIYFIEDRSTNGMLLNGRPLIKGDPAALKDGDQLQIDTFEVSVSLSSAADAAALRADAAPAPAPVPALPAWPANNDPLDFGLSELLPGGPAPGVGPLADNLIPGSSQDIPADLDPLSFLDAPTGGAGLIPETPAISAAAGAWNHSPGMEDHFRPPTTDVHRAASLLPDDWDPLADDIPGDAGRAGPGPAAAPRSPAGPTAALPGRVAAPVAAPAPRAAGTVPPELEQIFQIVVDGVMDVLRARAEIKNSFRLPVTVIQRSENNPLKFAATADEALQKILAPTNTAFLSGAAAFQDAFNDIRCHQMAMLAGVRAAFESLLGHFTPERFEHEADGGKRSAFGAKGKYWDKYREDFEALQKDPDECFRRLFGDEFASAYEDQLARLKSARRAGQSGQR